MENNKKEKNPAAVALGRLGGLAGKAKYGRQFYVDKVNKRWEKVRKEREEKLITDRVGEPNILPTEEPVANLKDESNLV